MSEVDLGCVPKMVEPDFFALFDKQWGVCCNLLMHIPRRHFLEILLALGVFKFLVSDKEFELTPLNKNLLFQKFLTLSGVYYFLQVPSLNTSKDLKTGSKNIADKVNLAVKSQDLNAEKIAHEMFDSMSAHLEKLLANRASEQDLTAINGFFSSSIGQKYAKCLKSIPYDTEMKQLVNDFWFIAENKNV